MTVKSVGDQRNIEYKPLKAEINTKIWSGKDAKLHFLPPLLSNSIVFLLPYELSKSSTNFLISVNEPSIVYIGYSHREIKNSSYGWKKDSFSKMGFEEVRKELKGSNAVQIQHDRYDRCSLTLFRKTLDAQNLKYQLQAADTIYTSVVIFVVQGN